MAGRVMVTCSLLAEDGGGQVIVSREICSALGGTEKVELSSAEPMNWEATARTTLEQVVLRPGLGSERRAVYQAAISRLR